LKFISTEFYHPFLSLKLDITSAVNTTSLDDQFHVILKFSIKEANHISGLKREERKPTRCNNIDDLLSIMDVDY